MCRTNLTQGFSGKCLKGLPTYLKYFCFSECFTKFNNFLTTSKIIHSPVNINILENKLYDVLPERMNLYFLVNQVRYKKLQIYKNIIELNFKIVFRSE